MIDKIIKTLSEKKQTVLEVKVKPNSGENKIVFLANQSQAKVLLKAAPDHGKANKELIKLFKKTFLCSEVKIIRGASSKIKLIKIIK